MPGNTEDTRVLSRLRARELSVAEVQHVGGGFIITHACTFDFKTCTMDQDCEQIPSCP
ncbi:MAG TPA: hypothetical protein VI636_00230 [Candidatus Angelobacter sp.]